MSGNVPRKWPNPRDFRFLVPSGKTVLRVTVAIAFIATCWLFLLYQKADLLVELAQVVIYGGFGIGADRLISQWRKQR